MSSTRIALMMSFLLGPPAMSAPAWHQDPFMLRAGGQTLDVGEFDPAGHAAPFLADIDADGKRDLVVGSFVGKFRFFRNVGSDAAPLFAPQSSWLQADGEDAQVPNFCCVPAGVQMVDLDKDGVLDMTSGSYYPGMVYWFKGLGGGKFAARQPIVDRLGIPVGLLPNTLDPKSNEPLSFKTNIAWTNWDDDDLIDLIVCNSSGLFVQKGQQSTALAWAATPSQPLFDSRRSEIRIEGGSALPGGEWHGSSEVKAVKLSAAPSVADWDGDGFWDILLGVEDGSVWWLRNTGRAGAPEFKTREQLIGPGVAFQWQDADRPPRPGRRAHVQAVDFNLDGKLDLLVGEWTVIMTPRPDLTAKERSAMAAILKKLEALDQEVNFQFDHARANSLSYAPGWGARKGALEAAEELEKSLGPYLVAHAVGERTTIAPMRGKVWAYLRR